MAESRTFELDAFSRIDIASGLTAIVETGAAQSVRVEAEGARLLASVDIRVVDGQLRARCAAGPLGFLLRGGLFGPANLGRGITLHITVPELTGAAASTGAVVKIGRIGGADAEICAATSASVTVESAKAEVLRVRTSTGGSLSVAGACERLELKFASTSRVSAIELACTELAVDGARGASARVTVIARVTGSLSSGAQLHLSGRPAAIDVRSTSGGELSLA